MTAANDAAQSGKKSPVDLKMTSWSKAALEGPAPPPMPVRTRILLICVLLCMFGGPAAMVACGAAYLGGARAGALGGLGLGGSIAVVSLGCLFLCGSAMVTMVACQAALAFRRERRRHQAARALQLRRRQVEPEVVANLDLVEPELADGAPAESAVVPLQASHEPHMRVVVGLAAAGLSGVAQVAAEPRVERAHAAPPPSADSNGTPPVFHVV